MASRAVVAAVAALVVGLGVVELLAPGTVPAPRQPYVLPGVGAALLGYAVYVLWVGRGEVGGHETPDPEHPAPAPVAGAEPTETLRRFPSPPGETWIPGQSVESRLRRAAVVVLARDSTLSRAEATERVDAGEWTDDETVAEFLRDDTTTRPTLGRRVREALAGPSPQQRLVDRSVDAIVEAGAERDFIGEPAAQSDEYAANAPSDPSAVGPPTVEAGTGLDRSSSGDLDSTNHWRGVVAVAVVCVGAGLLVERPAVLLAGVLGLAYAAYGGLSPPAATLSVEREIEEPAPEPGEKTTVSVTVTNDGPSLLGDLRLVDGVPPALSVVEGSPRRGSALRPGESVSFSYTVEARRGVHEFRPLLALVRPLSGGAEQELLVPAEGTISCVPPVRASTEPVPLRQHATPYTGPVETTIGGEGVEFRGVREYRPGDPTGRIDWNRRARTGELTTIEFREQRAGSVVLGVDDRPLADAAPQPYAPSGVERSLSAARLAFGRLLDDGHRVGVTGLDRPDRWLAPGTGTDHRREGEEFLAEAFPPVPESTDSTVPRWERALRTRLPEDAQLLVFSPLADAAVGRALIRLESRGVPVTVLSPDQTGGDDQYDRLERLRRRLVISDLRRRGVPVVEFGPTESLEHALRRGDRQ